MRISRKVEQFLEDAEHGDVDVCKWGEDAGLYWTVERLARRLWVDSY